MTMHSMAAKAATTASALLLAVPAPLLATAQAEGSGGGGIFSVEQGLAFWTFVIFFLVLFILGKYAWGPILGALDAREQGIQGSIDSARAMREEAEQLLEEHRKQLADARRQSQEIIAEGRAAADRLGKEIQDRARQEGERLVERARAEIEREKDVALAQVREEAVDLALAAAAHLLREQLDDDKDRALVKNFLSGIERPVAEA